MAGFSKYVEEKRQKEEKLIDWKSQLEKVPQELKREMWLKNKFVLTRNYFEIDAQFLTKGNIHNLFL